MMVPAQVSRGRSPTSPRLPGYPSHSPPIHRARLRNRRPKTSRHGAQYRPRPSASAPAPSRVLTAAAAATCDSLAHIPHTAQTFAFFQPLLPSPLFTPFFSQTLEETGESDLYGKETRFYGHIKRGRRLSRASSL